MEFSTKRLAPHPHAPSFVFLSFQGLELPKAIDFTDICMSKSPAEAIHKFFFCGHYPYIWDAIAPASTYYNNVDAIFNRQLLDLHFSFLSMAPCGFEQARLAGHPNDLPIVERVSPPRLPDDLAARMTEKTSHIFRYNGTWALGVG